MTLSMMSNLLRAFGFALVLGVPSVAIAQQSGQQSGQLGVLLTQDAPASTLEDVRLSLIQLDEELQRLRQQMIATGQVQTGVPLDAPTLQRLDGIETSLRTLTGRVETLQFDIRRAVDDGGRRFSDLDFRLTELEGNDTSFVSVDTPLGGGLTTSGASPTAGPQIAVTEQSAYDAALARFNEGDYTGAQAGFASFVETFSGGPLTTDARYWLAESYAADGRDREAATNYLNAFSNAPEGELAPLSLSKLAAALGRMGQVTESCLTFDEALNRFSDEGDVYVEGIFLAKQRLNCS